MKIFQEKAAIVRTEQLTADIYRITVKADNIAKSAMPGQFVMVKVSDGLDPLLRRPFSIHQVADDGSVQVLFKILGKGTRLMAGLQPGQEMDLVGPLGHGFSIAKECQHCLVGGGMGIAPLLFLAGQILKECEPAAIKVLLGARTSVEISTVIGDFESMGLTVQAATEDGSLGHHGLVTELLEQLDQQKQWRVYTCGPYPMLKAVVGQCKKQRWGCQVSLETFMACGLAACLGCAIHKPDMSGYVHVCKDGPVFEAEEVAWL
jgi:dihydroorotate dehydrogenase electron transfer subunit